MMMMMMILFLYGALSKQLLRAPGREAMLKRLLEQISL